MSPEQAITSRGKPVPFVKCPKCDRDFEPFMRGQVMRTFFLPWKWGRRDIWALICWRCKEIVGYEAIE